VVNFFAGMDERIGCGPEDTVLAVTSAAFDISVLELFWTLARGARVVLLGEHALSGAARPAGERSDAALAFSLFYFASADSAEQRDKYRLLIEGARFADERGFAAVWTPERHFHAFGGLYPNPAVTGAAVAAVTKRVQIRGGSVVLPLHNPLRVAEEWSVVDNLSGGRAGVALASGWHADDFALQPAHYADRKGHMLRGIETLQRLWRGEAVRVPGGLGQEVAVQIYPRPVQPQLPIWLTAAGNPDTFEAAGRLGAGVLTHLLGQSLEDVAEKIRIYRASLERHGHPPERGHVTLMLHTFLGRDREAVRAQVREPFISYLRSSADLMQGLARSMGQGDPAALPARDLEALLAAAFERYFDTSALFGTPESCAALVGQLKRIGVDEVACLIDFGVAADAVLESLELLDELRLRSNRPAADADYSLAAQAERHQATLLQCTPSLMRMVCMSPQALEALRPLRALLLGGEALPPALAEQVRAALPARLVNMYGPTETTIWSATHEVAAAEASVPIGRPIANTQIYVLDAHMQPVPPGVAGELYIGGDGLAHGYLRRPETTAERFVPNPFWDERPTTNDQRPTANDEAALADEGRRTKAVAGVGADPQLLNSQFSILNSRLYRTGDLARHRPDGTIEFLGRIDQQVKLRGYRIELEEIEQVLGQHPGVGEAVVLVEQSAPGDARLVAYVVPAGDEGRRTKDEGPTTNGYHPTAHDGAGAGKGRPATNGYHPTARADEGRRTREGDAPAPALHRSIAPAPKRPGPPTSDDRRPPVGGVSAEEGSAAPPLHRSTADQQPTAGVAGAGAEGSAALSLHGAAASLRAFLRERLPDYMVPAAFVVLEALPLTANGKLDRKALAASAAQQARPGAAYVAPGSQIERTIADIWSRALKLERVGVEDNFFDLGGHSLLMAQVHSQLQSAFQREFPLVVLLERPTVQALAQYFSQQPAQPALQSSQDRARRQTQSLQRQRQRIKGNAT
jgi:natural product biosynthesis luciferase-like monooxygenase protein